MDAILYCVCVRVQSIGCFISRVSLALQAVPYYTAVLRFCAHVCDSYSRFVNWQETWDAT